MIVKRALIVDDEEGYRKVLLNSLGDLGYETKAVRNGIEALDEIEKRWYSVILLDVKMPGMDGIELLERMQGARCPSSVIVITAYRDDAVVKEAIRKGAKRVITKPFCMDDIEACLGGLENDVSVSHLTKIYLGS